MEDIIKKLASRKLWMAIASTLTSMGTMIAGIATDQGWLIAVGAVCSVVGGGIYEFVNTWDAVGNAQANATVTTKTVTATATDKATVQAVMGTEAKSE